MSKKVMRVAVRNHRLQFIWSADEGDLHVTKSAVSLKNDAGLDIITWPKKKIRIKSQYWTGYVRIETENGAHYWITTYTKRWNLFVTTPLIVAYAILLNWHGDNLDNKQVALIWLLFGLSILALSVYHYLKFLDIRKHLQHDGYAVN